MFSTNWTKQKTMNKKDKNIIQTNSIFILLFSQVLGMRIGVLVSVLIFNK